MPTKTAPHAFGEVAGIKPKIDRLLLIACATVPMGDFACALYLGSWGLRISFSTKEPHGRDGSCLCSSVIQKCIQVSSGLVGRAGPQMIDVKLVTDMRPQGRRTCVSSKLTCSRTDSPGCPRHRQSVFFQIHGTRRSFTCNPQEWL